MVDRRARGASIEEAARRFLIGAGLRPIAANVRYSGGELDLILRDDRRREPTLVFVEVRYRQSQAFGGGSESVNAGKQRRLIHAAERFLATRPALSQMACRFDVLAASGAPAAPQWQWIEDAFRADGS